MSDFILIDGDQAIFLPTFGPAVVTVRPGRLTGSGKGSIANKKLCIDGDERSVVLPGCPYVTPVYSIPGQGTLKIAALAANQKARQTTTGETAVLLKGGSFVARFEVQQPAQQPAPPAPPIPDPTPLYSGSGSFITTNLRVRGT